MRAILALVRSSFLAASSYRLGFLFSIAGIAVTVVPMYFVTRAMQPIMAESIRSEGHDYFAFALVGTMVAAVLPSVVQALPSSLASGIGSGTLETLMGTPTPLAVTLLGLTGYNLLLAMLRVVIIGLAGILLGVHPAWSGFVPGLVVFAIVLLAYMAFGAIAGAMVVTFRTTGPLVSAVLAGSSLLGGVYFPTTVIPTWISKLSVIVPLSYGLRAIRRLWLDGASLQAVWRDVVVLLGMTTILCAVGVICLDAAIRDARKRGTLGQY